MWYVYIIESKIKDWTYVGYTNRLKKRLSEHNNGKNKATKPYAPFKLAAYIAVDSKNTAKELESYFKTGSGRAWFLKRLLNQN
jgi:predicted GIY-YIG superfamily endonuclease